MTATTTLYAGFSRSQGDDLGVAAGLEGLAYARRRVARASGLPPPRVVSDCARLVGDEPRRPWRREIRPRGSDAAPSGLPSRQSRARAG